MSTIAYPHIELRPDGVPIVAGTQTRVLEVAMDHLAHHWDATEIQRQHPHLNRGQIHSALAYYFDHKPEMDAAIQVELDTVSRIRDEIGESGVRARLRANQDFE